MKEAQSTSDGLKEITFSAVCILREEILVRIIARPVQLLPFLSFDPFYKRPALGIVIQISRGLLAHLISV